MTQDFVAVGSINKYCLLQKVLKSRVMSVDVYSHIISYHIYDDSFLTTYDM